MRECSGMTPERPVEFNRSIEQIGFYGRAVKQLVLTFRR